MADTITAIKKIAAKGYGAFDSLIRWRTLKPMNFGRMPPVGDKVLVEARFCGTCRPDVHQVENNRRNMPFSSVPGRWICGQQAWEYVAVYIAEWFIAHEEHQYSISTENL